MDDKPDSNVFYFYIGISDQSLILCKHDLDVEDVTKLK